MKIQIINFDDNEVSNFQRAIVRFRRDGNLIPIGAYLSTMKIIPDPSVGTACTDCVRVIRYSEKYFNSLEVEECVSALIHEVHHKFLNFFPRFERWAKQYKGLHPRGYLLRQFNIAQDYWINYNIKHEWEYPLGPGWMYDTKYNPRTMSTEMIASDLVDKNIQPPEKSDAPSNCAGDSTGDDDGNPDDDPTGESGPDEEGEDDAAGEDGEDDEDADGDNGSATDEDTDNADAGGGNADPEDAGDVGEGDDIILPEEYDGDIENELSEQDMRQMEANNRQEIAQSLRAAKGYAKGDGNTDPFTAAAEEAAYHVGFDFRAELMKWANESHNHGAWSWFRPNRRLKTSQGISLPSRHGKQLGTAVFIIDSSGSTDGPMVRYFLDETAEALRSLDYKKAVIIWCSDEVAKVQEFTKQEADAKHSLFDGIIHRCSYGTNFFPAFKEIAENYKDVRCITYLTDGGSGERDVELCAEIIRTKLNNAPTLWLLDDDGYMFTDRFREWVAEYGAGRCAALPAVLLEDLRR